MEPVDWLQSVPPAGQILCPTIFSRKVANYSCFRCFPTWDLFQVVYAAGLCLHILELIFSPPARYPDIFPVLNVWCALPCSALSGCGASNALWRCRGHLEGWDRLCAVHSRARRTAGGWRRRMQCWWVAVPLWALPAPGRGLVGLVGPSV